MMILSSIKSGFSRALNSSKGVLITWLSMFILVLVFIYPLRGALNSAFGNSMVTEKLADGFNIEIFADLGSALKSLLSFLTAGFIFTYFIGFVLNAFLTAGLFGSVRKNSGKFSSHEFFRSGSKNFWSFLIITLIITAIIGFLSAFIIGIPLIVVSLSDTISEKAAFSIVIIAITLCLIILPIFYLVADYARAWQAANENDSCFRALGAGFSRTFRNFSSSYIMMIILIFAQIVLGFIIMFILPEWRPSSEVGVLLLLIVSQLMLYLRFLLKTWRYASITSFMEEVVVANPSEN